MKNKTLFIGEMSENVNKKTIGGGILAIDTQTGDILLGRRGFNSKSPNTWATFGGTFELKDSNPKETAKREFKEETGYDGDFKISESPFFVNQSPHLVFYNYIGLFDGKFPVQVDGSEMLGYTWLPIDKLPDNLLPGVKDMFTAKMSELKKIIDNVVKRGDN